MDNSNFILLDTRISWNFEEDALRSVMHFPCPSCKNTVPLTLLSESYGDAYTATQKQIAEHLHKLHDSYHAISRFITKECPNGHQLDLVFIFGETQPARYVLVQAATILR